MFFFLQNSVKGYERRQGIPSLLLDFWKLVIMSFGLVTVAAVMYNVHIYRVRKHLFHFEKLIVLFHRSI
ncbi:hypothetical protein OSB04_024936 [Centaurea solstitialis]|uniref:Uncharacterized protein n=1 Tax=Centaurea solstitialis TaxID=347529 RepID=A0AA38SNR4_9ASTR|nr:hypothetical protein OSB04_024936 [Centaurea solstitialis]